jgi:hypothetical protein
MTFTTNGRATRRKAGQVTARFRIPLRPAGLAAETLSHSGGTYNVDPSRLVKESDHTQVKVPKVLGR